MTYRLEAWIHWKKLETLGEDDAAFVADVERLLTENARLQLELTNALVDHPCYQLSKDLEAENARFREALEHIADGDASTWPDCSSRKRAQAALEGK